MTVNQSTLSGTENFDKSEELVVAGAIPFWVDRNSNLERCDEDTLKGGN